MMSHRRDLRIKHLKLSKFWPLSCHTYFTKRNERGVFTTGWIFYKSWRQVDSDYYRGISGSPAIELSLYNWPVHKPAQQYICFLYQDILWRPMCGLCFLKQTFCVPARKADFTTATGRTLCNVQRLNWNLHNGTFCKVRLLKPIEGNILQSPTTETYRREHFAKSDYWNL